MRPSGRSPTEPRRLTLVYPTDDTNIRAQVTGPRRPHTARARFDPLPEGPPQPQPDDDRDARQDEYVQENVRISINQLPVAPITRCARQPSGEWGGSSAMGSLDREAVDACPARSLHPGA